MKPKKLFRLKKKGLIKKNSLYNSVDSDTSSFIDKSQKKKYNKFIDKTKIKNFKGKKVTKNYWRIIIIPIIFFTLFLLFYLLISRNKKIPKDYKNDIPLSSQWQSYLPEVKDKILNNYYYNESDNNNVFFYYYNQTDVNKTFNNYTNILNQNNISSINNSQTKIVGKENFNQKLYWGGQTFLDINKAKEEIRKFNDFKVANYNKIDFYKRDNPKVSLIITVHNQDNFLRKIYNCIQNQTLKDIEIIFVDDASTDNSSLIINEFMKEDKRIVYIKNEKNKRAFYSRNKGILISRGEYILVIDPDDLLLNDILIKAYDTAKNYNLDILQFYTIIGSVEKNNIWKQVKYKDGILYNSEVKKVIYYCYTRNLWDKLIKREIYIKSINFMKLEFHKETYFIHNDDTAFLGLISVANSYGFLEQIGYFYNLKNPKSTFHYYFDIKNMNDIFHSLFATMKYYYLQSDNNNSDKNLIAFNFFNNKINKDYKNKIQYLTNGFDYLIDVLDLYLNCTFFDENQKSKLKEFKNNINYRKKQINNKK